MDSGPALRRTLERLEALIEERGVRRPDLLDPEDLAARTALPVTTVRTLLKGGRPSPDTVNDRVRDRIRILSAARLARTGQRMSDLAGEVSRQLSVSAYWARQVCSGQKVPSIELLHGLVGFFRVEGGEAFFTAPAADALHRVLRPLLATLEPRPEGPRAAPDPLAAATHGYGEIRGIALRKAGNLPPERWNVLNATLTALLELSAYEHRHPDPPTDRP
ncbi:hypothetical protein ABZX40_03425 [Streptomyces sp. NPDC004610]|uniref:hypothetical protein n=1 Tax=unclassified Streptomyces TaxID=2593676 RepID=UPI0033A42B28